MGSAVDCPAIEYATTVDGLSIAFQRFGGGELDVVYLPGTVSHLEMAWEIEGMRHWMERSAPFCRFLKFDTRGTPGCPIDIWALAHPRPASTMSGR